MYHDNPQKCRLGEVRFSYVHLLTPYKRNAHSKSKYSATLLIPKSNPALKRDMDSAIAAAIEVGVSEKWGGKRPATVKQPVWDGDGKRQDGEPFGPECKGMWVVTASTNAEDKDGNTLPPPNVVHVSNVRTPLAPGDVYSGMWGYATVNFAPYYSDGNRGVGCYLNNVCKTRDDAVLGMGRANAEDDFADLEQAGASADAQQPAYQNTPYTAQAQPTYQNTPYVAPAQPQYENTTPQQTPYAAPQPQYVAQQNALYTPPQPQYVAPTQPQPQPEVNPMTGQPYNVAPYYAPYDQVF